MFCKKGQIGVLRVIFVVIIFVLLLGGGLGLLITTLTGVALDQSTFSGIEKFFIANLLLWIILAFILAVLYWGSSS